MPNSCAQIICSKNGWSKIIQKIARNVILINFIYCAVSATIVFATFSTLIRSSIGVSLAAILAVLTFAMTFGLSAPNISLRIIFKHQKLDRLANILFFGLFLFSLVFFIFVTSLSDQIFINWSSIPFLNWIKFIICVPLVIFWPGYFVLKLLDPINSRINSSMDRLVLSYVLSLFLIIILGVFNICLNHSFVASFAEISVLVVNTLFFAIFIFSNFKQLGNKKQSKDCKSPCKTNYFSISVLILILLFFFCGYIFIYSSFGNMKMMIGDLMNHHGYTLHILSGTAISSVSSYYPYFHIYLAHLIIMGGLPSTNAFVLFGSLNMFYILAFYVMVKKLTNENFELSILSTIIFILFNGFEWMNIVYLDFSNVFSNFIELCNHVYEYTGGAPQYSSFMQLYYYAPHTLGFITLFLSIYIAKEFISKQKIDFLCLFFLFITTSASITTHLLESYILSIFLFAFIFTSQEKEQRRVNLSILTYICSYLSIFVIDSLLLSKIILRQQVIYGLILGLTLLIVSVSWNKLRLFLQPIRQDIGNMSKKVIIPLVFITFYITGLSFIVMLRPLNYDVLDRLFFWGLPWYYYPIRMGAALFLAIGIFLIMRIRRIREISFVVFSAILVFIFIKLVSFFNITFFWLGIEETRLLPVLMIPVSIIASYGLSGIWKQIAQTSFQLNTFFDLRKIAAVGLVALVVIAGTGTTIYQIQLWSDIGKRSDFSNISPEEIEALNFMKKYVDGRVLVLYTSSSAYTFSYQIVNLAGRALDTREAFLDGMMPLKLSELINPETAYYFLKTYLKISYIAVMSVDLPRINTLLPKNSIIQDILSSSQIVYSDKVLTLYKLPNFHPPSSKSNLTFVYPEYVSTYSEIIGKPLQLLNSYPENGDDWTEDNVSSWEVLKGKISASTESAIGMRALNITIDSKNEFNVFRSFPSVDSNKYSLLCFKINWKHGTGSIQLRVGTPDNYWYTWLDLPPYTGIFSKISVVLPPALNMNYICFNIQPSSNSTEILLDGLSFFEVSSPIKSEYNLKNFCDKVIAMLAQSNLSYSISADIDLGKTKAVLINSSLIIPYDPKEGDVLYDNLLEYATRGGNVVVINGLGNGGFARLLSLTENNNIIEVNNVVFLQKGNISITKILVPQLSSIDPHIKILANYTSPNKDTSVFLSQKTIGKGNLICLNLLPYFQAMERNSTSYIVKAQLLSKLEPFFSIIAQTLAIRDTDKSVDSDRLDALIKGTAYIDGRVNITQTSEPPQFIQEFHVGKVDFESNSSSLNNPLVDVFVSSIRISGEDINLLIDSKTIEITPTASGSYSSLLVVNGDLIFRLDNNALVELTIVMSDGQKRDLIIRDSTLRLCNVSSTLLLIKSPHILVIGKILFERTYIFENIVNDKMSKLWRTMTFEGKIWFKIKLSDNNIFLLSNFGYQGDFIYPDLTYSYSLHPSFLYLEVFSIPWAFVFTSHFHLILLLCLTNLALLLQIARYRRKLRAK